MKNISGNFNTSSEEISAVKEFLLRLGLNSESYNINKYGVTNEERTAGDIEVQLLDYNKSLLFEVKNESIKRIKKYGQLGIDFISAFNFKQGMSFIRKPQDPIFYDDFISKVDKDNGFKWGKIVTSKSNIWLFYCLNYDGQYEFLDGFDFQSLIDNNFFDYLKKNCLFCVNAKPQTQMSYTDNWESAVFYIDLNDRFISQFKVDNINKLLGCAY